jgi:cysteine-rich repeat protein
VRNPGEACDDGNTNDDGNGCDALCQRNDDCGDEIVQALFEQCDDGNSVENDGCSTSCEEDGSCPIAVDVTANINRSHIIGTTILRPNSRAATCGGSDSSEVALVVRAMQDGILTASTVHSRTDFDTVISIRTDCRDPATELACNDGDGGNSGSTATAAVNAGEVYTILIEGAGTSTGTFEVSLELQ